MCLGYIPFHSKQGPLQLTQTRYCMIRRSANNIFKDSKSSIFENYLSRLKKCGSTASFEPPSLEAEFCESRVLTLLTRQKTTAAPVHRMKQVVGGPVTMPEANYSDIQLFLVHFVKFLI